MAYKKKNSAEAKTDTGFHSSDESGASHEEIHDQIAGYLLEGHGGASNLIRVYQAKPGATVTVNITNLSAEGQQLARWALEAWTNVTGINFEFVEGPAAIEFYDKLEGASTELVYSGAFSIDGLVIVSSFINISRDWLAEYGTTMDSYSFHTYIHEIGHALGLGHPGPYNERDSFEADNIFMQDSWQASVMSYFSQADNSHIDASYAYAVTPMIADIIAIHDLYGAPFSVNAGDTVYGYNSNVNGYLGQFFEQWTGAGFAQPVTLTLYDTGGTDTLDLRSDTANQRVDLRPESRSDVYQLTGNLGIARDTWIENFIAGSGNDVVIGNAVGNHLQGRDGNDELSGGLGADRLEGGAGVDTVSYAASHTRVSVNLETGRGEYGDADGDRIVDIENVIGSDYDDMLTGDEGVNELFGRSGDDELRGGNGDDVLEGGAGADRLFGGAGRDWVSYRTSDKAVTVRLSQGVVEGGHAEGDVINDIENVAGSVYNDLLGGNEGINTLSGGRGNDVLTGDAGPDRLEGGAGIDRVSYTGSDAGVEVNLKDGAGAGGHADGDTIIGVENVTGSAYRDVLTGDHRTNHLHGLEGDDELWGGDGDDVLVGGSGADLFYGGAGADWVSYLGSPVGVTVTLNDGTAEGGHAQGDVIVDIENIKGSAFSDVLGGDSGANYLRGGGGDDGLWGGNGNDVLEGGAGADRLVGGSGEDVVSYEYSATAVTVRLHSITARGGDAEGDTFAGTETVVYIDSQGETQQEEVPDIEHIQGSAYDDILAGDSRANRLQGGNGADRLYGGPGGGDDTLWGGNDDDFLYGGIGNDVLQGDAGADHLFGGAGEDLISYTGSGAAVFVSLTTGAGAGGHAEGDVIKDAENVTGSGFNDVLEGDDGPNQLSGSGGNDLLVGNAGDDVLRGEQGDDLLEGGAGADRMNGGKGADWVSYATSDAAVTVNLDEGTARGGHAEGDVITGFENILGSAYADQLRGNAGDNFLEGGAGADRLFGGPGMDTVSYARSETRVRVNLEQGTGEWGDAEGDVIRDLESVIGSAHSDVLTGDRGANELYGGDGDDVLAGGTGADLLLGGAGADLVDYNASNTGVTVNLGTGTGKHGHAAGDVIAGVENVIGSVYEDILWGDGNANRLFGGDGNDELRGGGGNDLLEGGAGADRMSGGTGIDTVSYRTSDESVMVNLEEDTVQGGHAEDDSITGFENVIGSAFADRILGDSSDNLFEGGAGADRLDGGFGIDTASYAGSDEAVVVMLSEGTGQGGHAEGDQLVDIEDVIGSAYADVLIGDYDDNRFEGGAGADRLDGGSGFDEVSYTGSDGAVIVDLIEGTGVGGDAEGDVITDVEVVIGSDYGDVLTGDEWGNRLIGGDGDDELWGEAGDDELFGNNGKDVLHGGNGVDLLFGGAGDDQLFGGMHSDLLLGGAGADWLEGGADTDVVSYVASDGAVIVNLIEGTGKGGHAEGDVIVTVEYVVGSYHGDVLTGDDGGNNLHGWGGNDKILGRGGSDSLEGGYGQDELWGGDGYDFLDGGYGNDKLWGEAGNDALDGREGDDELWGGSGDDFLYSHEGDDKLWGGSGEDALAGHEGNDELRGGEGNDLLSGGPGADRLDGGEGTDTALYLLSDWGVTIDLRDNSAWGGDADGDVIFHIENVLGSGRDDRLWGDDGDNILYGAGGRDELRGMGGDDILDGGYALWWGDDPSAESGGPESADRLWGGEGNDVLEGGGGPDRLWGDEGNDRLRGGQGADWMEGGEGADTFIFGRGDGEDTIADFTDGEDVIDLTAFDLSGFEELTLLSDPDGTTIDLTALPDGGGGSILLEGFDKANLDTTDFVFT